MPQYLFKKIAIVLVIVIKVLTLNAQSFDIKNYTTDHGLPQNHVDQLMLDKFNNLWIGTHNGIAVFQGSSFRLLNHKDQNLRIGTIFKINDTLYFSDGRLRMYRCETHPFKICETKVNNILKSIEQIPHEPNVDKVGILDLSYKLIYQLGHKNIIGFDSEQQKLDLLYNFLPNYEPKVLYYIIQEKLVQINTNSEINVFTSLGENYYISSEMNRSQFIESLVFSTDDYTFQLHDNNLYKLTIENKILKRELIYSGINLSKDENLLKCGYYNEYNGQFYFGSLKNGLYVLTPKAFTVLKNLSNESFNILHENKNTFYSQVQKPNGDLVVNNYMTYSGGKFDYIRNIENPMIRAANFMTSASLLMYSDHDKIYFQKCNQISKGKSVIFAKSIPNAGFTGHIVSVTEIDSLNLYLTNGPVLFTYKNHNLTSVETKSIGLPEDTYAQYLYYHKLDSIIYILTPDNIYNYDLKLQQISVNKLMPIGDYRIMSSLSPTLNFIGTYGQGYYIYDGQKWTLMPLDENGYLKFAHAALCDNNGNVWISTNNGLFRARLQDMLDYINKKCEDVFYFYYDKSLGFLNNEFNGGCQAPAIKLIDGRFSFSNMDGLVQFDPLKVPVSFPEHPAHIAQIWLNDQILDSVPLRLITNQDVNSIKLELSTPFYGHRNNFIIQYKINGIVNEWSDLIDNKFIVLQNANHGKYEIEIRKRKGFGAQDFDYLYYPITVLPYFYQTWWFMVCVGLGLILIIIIAARWYSRKLATQKLKLEKMVQDRNQSLIDINLSLEDKIKQNEMFHSVMVHDIKAPLFFMGTISDEILKGLDHLSKDDIRNNISSVKQAANHLNNFIINFLTWVKSKNDNLSLQREMVNLADLMQELKTFYSHTDKIMKGRLSIVTECDDNITVQANRQLLMIVLGNLLSNSIKFSTQGTITLYAYLNDEGGTVIGCKDQGKGMSSETIALLTSSQYKGNAIREDSFRMGYVFINDIIKMMTATLFIHSIPGEGTDVSVEIPL